MLSNAVDNSSTVVDVAVENMLSAIDDNAVVVDVRMYPMLHAHRNRRRRQLTATDNRPLHSHDPVANDDNMLTCQENQPHTAVDYDSL
jgi:hypothetical protein